MSTEIYDITVDGVSDCCSAKVYVNGFCADCGEHTVAIKMTADEAIAALEANPNLQTLTAANRAMGRLKSELQDTANKAMGLDRDEKLKEDTF